MEVGSEKDEEEKSVSDAAMDPDFVMDRSAMWKFIILSILGALVFLVPLPDPYTPGTFTIGLGIMVDTAEIYLADILPWAALVFIGFSGIFTPYASLAKPDFIKENDFLEKLFITSPVYYISRFVGMVFYVMFLFEIGPQWLIGPFTGGVPGDLLIPLIMLLFLFSGPAIVLLTDFGLMEFIGTMIRKLMRPLFKIPGRSGIDTIASVLASSTVGVVVTTTQYDKNYYTGKEAAIIASNFSLVSVPYILFMATTVGHPELFFQLLISCWIVSIIIALILCRIWPLKGIVETYKDGTTSGELDEKTPEHLSLPQWAVRTAVEKARRTSMKVIPEDGAKIIGKIYFSLLPLVMAWATIVLVVAEETPVFEWISYPFGLLFELMGVPEAYELGTAYVLGFPDQFLAAVIGAGIESPVASFLAAGISVTGLLYITEVGVIILDSDIPLDIKDITVLYFMRAFMTAILLTPLAFFFAG